MSNTNAPYGFKATRKVPGTGMDFGMSTRTIKGTSTNAVFKGDVLIWDAGNAGFVTTATSPGTATIVGIAVGFQWQQANTGSGVNMPWNTYWPGGTTITGDVSVLVIDDPNAIFQVQCGATKLQQSDVGANIQYVNGTGNTNNGLSGAYLGTTSNTTNTLPFQVYNILGSPVTDSTSAYNQIEVTFNNQIYKNTTGA